MCGTVGPGSLEWGERVDKWREVGHSGGLWEIVRR